MANTFVITGANSSLAIPTLDHLLQHSPQSTLVLTVRNTSDGDANTDKMRVVIAKHANARVSIRKLDLNHLSDLHEFAGGIAAEIADGSLPPLAAIIGFAFHWNLVSPLELTDDGYEKTFQVNYLSHFALVLRLIRSFRPEGGRIVLFTSDGHEPGKNNLEKIPPAISASPAELDLLANPAEDASSDALGHGMHRYANSKLALVMFTHALNRRLQQDTRLKGITAVVMNPGNLADSRALLTNTPRKLIFLSKYVLGPLLPLFRFSKPKGEFLYLFTLSSVDKRSYSRRVTLTLSRNSGSNGPYRRCCGDRRRSTSHERGPPQRAWLFHTLKPRSRLEGQSR
jgi:NAD(P)-dependent dehydrogenase (short-subunit alcohol dehydrogenase family)